MTSDVLAEAAPPTSQADPVATAEAPMPVDLQVAFAALMSPLPADSVVDYAWAVVRWRLGRCLEVPMVRGSRYEQLVLAVGGVPYATSQANRMRFAYEDLTALSRSDLRERTYRYWRIEWTDLLERAFTVKTIARAMMEK